MADRTEAETVELLQALIRNRCVNDGTVGSGQEVRNADTIEAYLDGSGIAVERYEAAPGRVSLVARIEGSGGGLSLCLDGHTDVVPVNEDGWTRDPFGGELVDGEVWGRGAVDMLNLTASMVVAVRHLAAGGFRPKGDLVLLCVADEESGSAHGARFLADRHADVIRTDYALTENGGLHGGPASAPSVGISVGEKGVAWRRLTIKGTPGHGSQPFKADNALVVAAGVITRLAEYRPPARLHDLWPAQLDALDLDDETRRRLLDPVAVDAFLDELPRAAGAGFLHACCHTTFSPNVATSQTKTNVIPDTVSIDVDVRTVPGDHTEEVEAHLREALGDLLDRVDVEVLMDDRASTSPTDTPLWDSVQRAVANAFPSSTIRPRLIVGFTDARVHRDLGAISYGAGLLSPGLSPTAFGQRFHGNDERIDVESLGLTTRFWRDVVVDLLG